MLTSEKSLHSAAVSQRRTAADIRCLGDYSTLHSSDRSQPTTSVCAWVRLSDGKINNLNIFGVAKIKK